MKRFSLSIVLLLMWGFTHAQNLVPNPSFEDYLSCPTAFYSIQYSPNYNVFNHVTWWACGIGWADYYNACSPVPNLQVPNNLMGPQPARTGNAYAGITVYNDQVGTTAPTYPRVLLSKLTSPLQAGKVYFTQFYVSFSTAKPGSGIINVVAIDKIGASFSKTVLSGTSNYLKLPYHIKSKPGVWLSDTVNWMEVSGFYQASGGEEYIYVGNFDDGQPLNYTPIDPPVINTSPGAILFNYYFVDDVSVIPVSCDTARFAKDTLACNYEAELKGAPGANFYTWNTGGTTQKIIVDAPGTYWCIAGFDTCDVRIDTFHVRLAEDTIVQVHDTFYCKDGQIDMVLAVPAGGKGYKWSTGEQYASTLVLAQGTYWCRYFKNCHMYSDTFHVQQFKETQTVITDTVVCKNNNLKVQLRSSPGAESYRWSRGDTTETIVVSDTGSYWCVAVKDCNAQVDSFHLTPRTFDDDPRLGNDTILCKSQNYHELKLGKDYPTIVRYKWNTGDTTFSITPATSGEYIRAMTDGCNSFTDTMLVLFISCDSCIFVPTAFTPNADGKNDEYGIQARCEFDFFDLRIFNRWGQLVFNSAEPGKKWDGNFLRESAPVGSYFYQLRYQVRGGVEKHVLKGDILLIR